MHASSKALTLSWRRFLSYRNQSIDLFCKSMNQFLYNRNLLHERFKIFFIHYTESLFLHVVKHNLLFFFFFYLAFLYEYLRFHFHPLQRHLYISWVIAAESSPVCIAGSRNRTWTLWYTLSRIYSFYSCTGSCCCQENA